MSNVGHGWVLVILPFIPASKEPMRDKYSCLCSAAVEHLIVCRDCCDLTPNRRGDGAVPMRIYGGGKDIVRAECPCLV